MFESFLFWLLIIPVCTIFLSNLFLTLFSGFFSLFFPPNFPVYKSTSISGLVIPFDLYFACSCIRLFHSHPLCFSSSFLLMFSYLSQLDSGLLEYVLISHLQIAMAGAKRKLDTAPAPSTSQGASQSTNSNHASHFYFHFHFHAY